jgi:hypothetical protein
MPPRGHYIQSQRLESAVGLLLFVGGAFLLYDAYDGRGKDQPRVLRIFSFW